MSEKNGIHDEIYDVAIVGNGIAGASFAWCIRHLGRKVLLIDQSARPPEHSTSRSVALYSKSYAYSPAISALTTASEAFLRSPPEGFTDTPLLVPRDTLHVFSEEHVELGAKLFGDMMDFPARQEITTINKGQILDLVPIFRKSYPVLGILETGSGDLDPAAMWAGYRKGFIQAGGVIVNDAELMEAHYFNEIWNVSTKAGNFRTRRLVNSAGAWGDVVAGRSGVRPIGLKPMIRTALIVRPSDATGSLKAELPFVFLPSDDLYFRVQNGSITMSPADETPTVPSDAQPDMVDIATTIEKFKTVTTVVPEARKPKAWAGLRTFTPDKNPAIGFDPGNPAFFWLVGQGGFGIESAPAASALAAAIFLGQEVPEYLLRLGFSFKDLSVDRFTKVVA